MDIIFSKGTPMEEVYKSSQINAMTRAELKQLKSKCVCAMSDIATKRSRYKNENTEVANSKEFWTRMNKYKSAIAIYQRAIFYIGDLESKKGNDEHEDNEHWLYCYYQESRKMLTEDMVKQLSEMADERAGYHVVFNDYSKKHELPEY